MYVANLLNLQLLVPADILGIGGKGGGPREGTEAVLAVEWPVGKSRYFSHDVQLLLMVLYM